MDVQSVIAIPIPCLHPSPPLRSEKRKECRDSGAAIRKLLEMDLKPRDIMTRQASGAIPCAA